MIEKINNDLNKILNEEKTIFVLKGFNNIIKKMNFCIDHIFDLKIIDDLNKIFEVDDKIILSEMLTILNSGKSCYCLLEELLYIDKKNLTGVVSTFSDYKIKIIDLGCFEYYYPGLICNSIEETINKFDSDDYKANILQEIYTEYNTINGVPFISYNILDNCKNVEMSKLYNMYSGDFISYEYKEKKVFELLDNSPTKKIIEVFYEALYGMINQIDYICVEKKENIFISKLLFVLNELGININILKNKKNYDLPENYDEYVSILKRIDSEYEFKEFPIYDDPFTSNDKTMINQSIIIDTIYNNIKKANMHKSFRDIFVTAPTGAGKSVLFQIPAIKAAEELNLVTIIISPLIGLMKDQVKNIEKLTNCAATINSDYTPYEKEVIKMKIKKNEVSILYISPETLLSNYDIENLIGDRTIGMLVVDEAHTVATWGKNFRPDYWYLGEYIDRLRHRQKRLFPIATFTATATISNGLNDMYHDIIESLNMTCDPFFGNVKRDNIGFDINLCKKDHAYKEEKDEKVVGRIKEFIQTGEKSLVYFPFVRNLEEIYNIVPKEKVGKYFGGMDKNAKDVCIEEFRTNDKNVVLATKAFGMGIDVKSIKNVYHFAPTGNLADYV
ncbi:MAG TPA: DEAD/DEAH box helicase [Bacilli bacterium]|nr:DEAD/DEAH box helicase [Bacilli bacterium]